MAAFDLVISNLECPHCCRNLIMESEIRFGPSQLETFEIKDGIELFMPEDVISMHDKKNYIGLGYVECSSCGIDFWTEITVDDGIIISIKVKKDRAGYKSS